MNLYSESLNAQHPSTYTFNYQLSTTLFTDDSQKHRLIALPEGTAMVFNGDGLPDLLESTIILKRFTTAQMTV